MRDRVTLLRATAIVALGYGFGASLQSTFIYSRYVPEWAHVSVWSRLGANALGVGVLVGMLWALRVHARRSSWAVVAGLVVASAVCAVGRHAAQLALGVYTDPDVATRDSELAGGFVVALISAGIGMWALLSRRRMRSAARRAERGTVHVELAVQALEDEEIRVRRAVAEGLHGTLQGKLVLVDAELDAVVRRMSLQRDRAADVAALRRVQEELTVVRELDVRQMSRLLYPDRLELGLVPAVRAMLSRVPSTIATRLAVTPAVREVDDPELGSLTVAQRLLAVRVVEEGITNALKYGPATTIVVDLDLCDGVLVVGVENDGPTYDPATAAPLGGTARLAERIGLAHGAVELRPRDPRGARLEARLPL
ncbi:sensor histidine kinase [Cellulomonas fulva]|uniref:sensor histidine kinase n=1 Tax=Cellulomonas fulva TaxID=2835530 RepID=UPI0027DD7B14|nr:ATP-binding protein [Cellulomonas fulva]